MALSISQLRSAVLPKAQNSGIPCEIHYLYFLSKVLFDYRKVKRKQEVLGLATLGTKPVKIAYCNDMKFFLIEALMFLGALAFTYLLRRAAGKLIKGPPVVLWCILFAFTGGLVTAYIIDRLALFSDFIDLSNANPFYLFINALRIFWEAILLGGFIGMILAMLPRFSKKKKLEDTKPKV